MKKDDLLGVLVVMALVVAALAVRSPQARGESSASPVLSGEAQIYALNWDGAIDGEGQLLPGALAPRNAWQPVLWGYPEAQAELAVNENGVLIWTGDALENWQFTGDEWALTAIEVITGSVPLTATTAITGETAAPDYELFLNGETAVALGRNAPDACLIDSQFYACDAGEKLSGAVQVLETADGRWLYAQAGTVYDVGWTQTQALADAPLSIWTDIAVEGSGPYTLTVSAPEGVMLAVQGQGSTLYPLGTDRSLNVRYEGSAPSRVTLYRQEKTLPIVDVVSEDGQMRVVWGQAEGIFVPAGAALDGAAVNLEIDGAMKAARACAQWSNANALTLTYYDANSGQPLGQAVLSVDRPCNIVMGKVNRPFSVKISGEDVWVFHLETQVSY